MQRPESMKPTPLSDTRIVKSANAIVFLEANKIAHNASSDSGEKFSMDIVGKAELFMKGYGRG